MPKLLSWVDLEQDCPINITRIVEYSKDFNKSINLDYTNLDLAKESLFSARGDLDMMITTLIQLLYDEVMLKTSYERVLFAWLKEDLGRFMKRLDELERELMIDEDFVDPKRNRVSTSRISAYAKTLRIAAQSIIYESLLKTTKEYYAFNPTEEIKREPRTFLYMLFHILQITLSVMGGLTREKTIKTSTKGILTDYPASWRILMSKQGQEKIKEGFHEENEEKKEYFDDLNLDFEEDLDTEEESEEDEEDEDISENIE